MDVACTGAKTQDIGRPAHGSSGRKNPGPRKPINKAAHTEPVLQDLLIGSLPARGLKGTQQQEPGARSKERAQQQQRNL